MLSYKLDGDILEVVESLHSFRDTKDTYWYYDDTEVTYWYYDIVNWKQSSHGKKNDVPDREMCVSAIDWVKRFYFPKVGL